MIIVARPAEGANIIEFLQIWCWSRSFRQRLVSYCPIAAWRFCHGMNRLCLIGGTQIEKRLSSFPGAVHEALGHTMADDGEEANAFASVTNTFRYGVPVLRRAV